ncbi:MAG: hypothetical protein QG629_676 [Patescibacteria group bacterium]|nr:PIN domain-containing protein [Candidatus Saccharibacteria bacterium]MDQ5963594.1 hypothetical protein [Patescibacteria group bacterium]
MSAIDTNVLVRLFIDTNAAQTTAVQKYFATEKHISIADIALIEALYVLTEYYGKNRTAACRCIASVLASPKVNCNRPLFTEALYLYEEHVALSVEDCCLVVYAELNNSTPLYTFDKKLARQTQHTELLQ